MTMKMKMTKMMKMTKTSSMMNSRRRACWPGRMLVHYLTWLPVRST
jgi:hypothetical protein